MKVSKGRNLSTNGTNRSSAKPVGKSNALAVQSSNDPSSPQPWDMQPWDTSTSFHRFSQFYLAQQPARSLVEAYRRYRIGSGSDQDRVQRIKTAPGVWNNWAYGRDSHGQPISGALTWAERARAYDVEQARQAQIEYEAKWRRRQQELRESEWQTGTQLLERGERMLKSILFEEQVDETVSADGTTHITNITYGPTKWSERDILATLRLASDLRRRGAGEAPTNPRPEVDWREQARKAGFDPDQLMDDLFQVLAEQYMTGGDQNG